MTHSLVLAYRKIFRSRLHVCQGGRNICFDFPVEVGGICHRYLDFCLIAFAFVQFRFKQYLHERHCVGIVKIQVRLKVNTTNEPDFNAHETVPSAISMREFFMFALTNDGNIETKGDMRLYYTRCTICMSRAVYCCTSTASVGRAKSANYLVRTDNPCAHPASSD